MATHQYFVMNDCLWKIAENNFRKILTEAKACEDKGESYTLDLSRFRAVKLADGPPHDFSNFSVHAEIGDVLDQSEPGERPGLMGRRLTGLDRLADTGIDLKTLDHAELSQEVVHGPAAPENDS